MNKDLSGAFGDKGTKVNAIAYGHPFAQKILDESKQILNESETGQTLIRVHSLHNIPIHVIKGTGESGFNPQGRVIYLQVPGKTQETDPKIITSLIRGLREAEQEIIGFTAPDPTKDLMEYAAVIHAKNMDAIVYICKVVKELSKSSHFPVLLDTLAELGLDSVYKAYEKNASTEEIFDAYAGR
ncbi:MAG: hypothetical protein J0L77_05190 [Alphaproteobacteria bacterium]|nr:hypothetical protein [Alphaproteobacteria bacterium]